VSKKQKKSSSSSSGSASGSSSSSGSSSEDEPDQEQEQEQERLPEQQQQQEALQNEPEPESEPAQAESESAPVTPAEAEQPGSPSAKSQPSSFLSSVRSRSNSPQLYNQAAVDLNISHEDLSDVSDIEADEKRSPSKNSPQRADEDEDGAISNDSLPAVDEEDEVQQELPKQNGKAASGDEENEKSSKETKVSSSFIKKNKFF